MPSLPLVSVITPSFNQARFLETAIRSVLGQGYPRLEYLIVDGGSTDGSVDVIRRYAPALTWWVSEPDRGQAEAINKGLRRARGEIVAWLNSDDAYAPQAIAAAVAAFQAHPEAAVVFGQGVSFDAAGRPFRLLPAGPWGRADLMTFHILTQPAVFMRRSAVVKAGFLDEDFHFLLDHRLWLKMSLLGELVHVPQVWAFARYHPAAKNAAQAARFGDEALRLARWLATSPAFAEDYARHKRKIWAAARPLSGLEDSEVVERNVGARLGKRVDHQTDIAFRKVGIFHLGEALAVDVERQGGANAVCPQVVGGMPLVNGFGEVHVAVTGEQSLPLVVGFADAVVAVAADEEEVEVVFIAIAAEQAERIVVGAGHLDGVHFGAGVGEVEVGVSPDHGVGVVQPNAEAPFRIGNDRILFLHGIPAAGRVGEVVLEEDLQRRGARGRRGGGLRAAG